MKTALPQLGVVFVAALVAGIVSSASGADSFRIDSSRLFVPSDLSEDWNHLKKQKLWSKLDGTALTTDGEFVRFLGRHYVFKYKKTDVTDTDTVAVVAGSPSGVAVATSQNSKTSTSFMFTSQATWFVDGNCVTKTLDLSKVIDSKREAFEAGLGQSLKEIQDSLRYGNVVPQTTTVVWAQFRKKTGQLVAWPINGLAADDQRLLMPFADLALDLFENVLLPTAECVKFEDPRSEREAARSGGRRMTPSDPQLTQSGDFSPPTGRARERPIRAEQTIKGKEKNPRRSVERFGILITKFVAVPGTLTFRPIDSFVSCIRAATQGQALAAARRIYRTKALSPNERRFSYRFALTDSGACGDKGEGAAGSESDLATSSSNDGSEGASKSDTKPENINPIPDPISTDEKTGDPSGHDVSELEAVPN
jgi:hypothetical protein